MPLSQLTRVVSELDHDKHLSSFAQRIMFFTGGIVVLLGALLAWAIDRHLLLSATQRESGSLVAAASRQAEAFESALTSYATSARLLAELTADERDAEGQGANADTWLPKASGMCRQFLANYEVFLQVRLISESNGRELVRWDRASDGRLFEVHDDELQTKIHRDYVRAGFACADGEIYMSAIDLNREHGAIASPDTPVLRVAVPVPQRSNHAPRILAIINVDLTRVFQRMKTLTQTTRGVRMYDNQGRTILHPEPGRAFTWDHKRDGGLLADDLPDVPLLGPIPQFVTTKDGDYVLVGTARAEYLAQSGNGQWLIVMSQPYALVISSIRNQRIIIALGILTAVGVMIVVVGILARRMVAPLHRLSSAVLAFGSGNDSEPIPTTSSREIAMLSAAFIHMRSAIIKQQSKIISEVAARKSAQESIALRNRDLETIVFITSHDLREPLRAIRSFSEIVLDSEPNISLKSRDFIQRIRRAGERMDTLMENLLQLSRAQREAVPDRALPSGDLVAAAREQHEAKISSTAAQIHIHNDLPVIFVHRIWATQAFSNLIGNALKFCKPGVAPRLEVKCYKPGPNDPPGPGLVFADHGTGVDPDQRERIFILFQRNVPREVEGTGTGLAIVREVAHRHGGQAWVRDNPEGGSEFIITFSSSGQPVEIS